MPTIQSRFVAEKDILSEEIRFFEGGSLYSHVEFVLTPDQQAALGVTSPYVGAHSSGITAYDDAYYSGSNTITRARYYALDVTDEQQDALLAWIKPRLGSKYDFTDIFGIMLHQPWTEENRYICSAFVGAALWAIGIESLNVLPNYQYKITPEMLHLSAIFIGKCYKES